MLEEWRDFYIAYKISTDESEALKKMHVLGLPITILGIELFLHRVPRGWGRGWRISDPISGYYILSCCNPNKRNLIREVKQYLKEKANRDNVTPLEVINRERRKYISVSELPEEEK